MKLEFESFCKQIFYKQQQPQNFPKDLWKRKIIVISEQTVFHRFRAIVKDMMNILLDKCIYFYANVYKYSLQVLQEKR